MRRTPRQSCHAASGGYRWIVAAAARSSERRATRRRRRHGGSRKDADAFRLTLGLTLRYSRVAPFFSDRRVVDLPACAAPPPHVALKGPTFTREGGATVMMSSATTRATRHQSAIVFTSELARRLEDDPSLRLPTTYAGVRRVRPANGFRPEVSSRKRKSACRESDTSSQVDAHQGATQIHRT
ncbi:hypothetical protein THAOC_14142 [Thalassiosira oceanica]|uniref:Uncharacterized protein n=1 Tax=Thalassiosira oceanica TaxID=159749 RepID=K0T3U7_THAOC|nr:hypothetical protein THAOC_14142 [Thalassiosira oceanica]|eukprot:EJK65057.1 hypothetical protein THAOC_14142 [Thalassiosira oceanica]